MTTRPTEDLLKEIDALRALCACAYQLAGIINAPVRFLDAFSDGANGDAAGKDWVEELLPVTLPEQNEMNIFYDTGCFVDPCDCRDSFPIGWTFTSGLGIVNPNLTARIGKEE
jgi:hypothetical protein